MLTLSKGGFSLSRKFDVHTDLNLAGFAYVNYKVTSDVLTAVLITAFYFNVSRSYVVRKTGPMIHPYARKIYATVEIRL